MTDEAFMDEVVEEEEAPLPAMRKRRKFRKYPKPICTPEQKAALWKHQRGL